MIDLHCHSTCSDGTVSPENLAEMGKDFHAFSVTDHDNCDGARRFLAASHGQHGLRLAGIELSIEPGEGYAQFHLLGLGIDVDAPALTSFLAVIREGRTERNHRIVARLAQLGMSFDEAELLKYANGEIIARPHIARVLMDHGWASSVKDAFERLLGKGRPAFVTRYRPTQEEAIEAIHAAGGIAVMAHPRYWTLDFDLLRKGLVDLRDRGLDGIEALYKANLPGETVEHMRIAKDMGLLITAGSDYHGANKPEIPLGMKSDQEQDIVERLASALTKYRRKEE